MAKLLNLLPWRRRRLEQDLERELRDHLERRVADLTRSGISQAESRRCAAAELGDIARLREEVRATWTWNWADHLLRDVRYAARILARSPGFTAAAMLSLALGIGANTAIFSLLDQALIRCLAVNEPHRLVLLEWKGNSLSSEWGSGKLLSYPLCQDLQQLDQVFAGILCRHPATVNLSAGVLQEPVRAELVSGSFFPLLGVGPEVGQLIGPQDDLLPGAHPVAVLSYSFWKNRLGGAQDVVGRKVLVNNHPMTVIGIAPQGFRGIDPIQAPAVWIPAMMTAQAAPEIGPRLFDRRTAWMHVLGRLKPGMTVRRAKARLQPWFKSILETEARGEGFPSVAAQQRRDFLASTIDLLPAARGLSPRRGALSRPFWVMIAATALLLLLACLNVAGLLVARGAARNRELTIRLALGASRTRLAGQMLVEASLLALSGGLLGLLAAPAVSQNLLSRFLQDSDLAFRFDLRVFLFAFLACFAAALLCGLAPALSPGPGSVAATINNRSSPPAGGAVLLRKAIVVVQMAFTLILLIGAGLFVQTVVQLRAKDLGFVSSNLVMFRLDPPANGYSDSSAVQIMGELLDRLQRMPGVEGAAVANTSLFTGGSFSRSLTIQSDERIVTERTIPGLRVSPGFFATLGIQVIAGREFDVSDVPRLGEASYRSMIVNQSFARRYFGSRNPVGERIGIGARPDTRIDIEVIGVVEDFNYRYLRESQPEGFFLPFGAPGGLSADGVFFLRVNGEPASAFGAIRAAVAEIDGALPVTSLTTLDDQRDRALRSERMLATWSTGFGATALLLSVIGLYGVLSFVVTRRRREIGVRLALGATPGAAVWLIVRDALLLIGAGAGAALPAAFVLGRLVEAQLFGLRAFDGPTVASASALLTLVALAAAMIPACRAASVNPTDALRFE